MTSVDAGVAALPRGDSPRGEAAVVAVYAQLRGRGPPLVERGLELDNPPVVGVRGRTPVTVRVEVPERLPALVGDDSVLRGLTVVVVDESAIVAGLGEDALDAGCLACGAGAVYFASGTYRVLRRAPVDFDLMCTSVAMGVSPSAFATSPAEVAVTRRIQDIIMSVSAGRKTIWPDTSGVS